jgi:chemotaxis protein MotA
VRGLIGILGGNLFGKAFSTDNLKMMFELFNHAHKSGAAKLEEDVDNPSKSQIFTKFPKFLKNHHALDFLCPAAAKAA